MESGKIWGIEASEYADYYIKGREEGTLRNYAGAFGLVKKHVAAIKTSVFQ